MTGRPIWRDMTKFWGTLFGINFAMGVATGLTMEFQFGTNWAYYSHYVGDIFGAPLAIEGLMAFFLEATFVGLFFFGWDRLSGCSICRHLPGGARHQPVGAVDPDRQRLDAESGRRALQPETMRMEVTDFAPCCSTRSRRRSSSTRSAPAMSPARCSCCRSAPGTCCAAATAARQALDDGRGELRPRLGAVGRRAGRRERLHRRREPEDEDRRDRGDVAHRAGARRLHPVRPARHGGPRRPATRSRFPGCWA
jgi:hypothetical protein